MGRQLPIVENCDDCGACCMDQVSPPFVGLDDFNGVYDVEFAMLPADLKAEYYAYYAPGGPREKLPPEAPCYWFDLETKRCKHYEHRPRICRDFAINGKGCKRHRAARIES